MCIMRTSENMKVVRLFILVCLTVMPILFLLDKFIVIKERANRIYHSGYWEDQLSDSTVLDSLFERTRKLKNIVQCRDRELTWKMVKYGDFWTVQNIFIGTFSRNVNCIAALTYTTIGDYTFIDNLNTLVTRWLAPISFAIYAPGSDFAAAMDAIQYARNCLAESNLIRTFVSFHIFFPSAHMPTHVPHTPADADGWPYDCYVAVPPYAKPTAETYKTVANLTYPINVARNIARKAANTHFILASDIELYPSPRLSDMFLDMVENNASVIAPGEHPRVFPLPVFELESNASIPHTKTELLKMLETRQAIPFHSLVCKSCHMVPKQTAWYKLEDSDNLSVSAVSRREHNFKYWEPFYISDNLEPLFDERVTWEGQRNKRIQGFAMCLLGYEYHILHPAFLVHSPGIKHLNLHTPRQKYVAPMNALIKKTIEPEYRILYGSNSACRT